MIAQTHRQSSFNLLVSMQGSVVPAITPKIAGAAAVGVFAELINHGLLGETARDAVNFTFAPFTALGVAISLFLGFHNNTSYSRWWEARTLWGNQIIVVRNLIRFLLGTCRSRHHKQQYVSVVENGPDGNDEGAKKTSTSNISSNNSVPWRHGSKIALSEDDWRFRVIRLAMAQTHALRSQLRPTCRADIPLTAQQDRDRFLTEEERHTLCQSPNPASAILLRMATILGEESELPEYSLIRASQIIDDLCAIQTGCERIHNTTIPFAYSLLVHRTSTFYVILSPFAMAGTMAWWTPVFTGILAYTFFGLDEVARQIQEPFRDEPQCLALSAMCRTVEIDVCEAFEPRDSSETYTEEICSHVGSCIIEGLMLNALQRAIGAIVLSERCPQQAMS